MRLRWVSTLWLSPLVIAIFTLPGCGPSVSQEDLGTLVFDVPKVPGSDEPYPLPVDDTPADAAESAR